MPNLSSFSRQLKEILKGKGDKKTIKYFSLFSHKRRVFVTKNVPLYTTSIHLEK